VSGSQPLTPLPEIMTGGRKEGASLTRNGNWIELIFVALIAKKALAQM